MTTTTSSPVKNYTLNNGESNSNRNTPTKVSLLSVMDEEMAQQISRSENTSEASPKRNINSIWDEMKRKPHPQSVIYNAEDKEKSSQNSNNNNVNNVEDEDMDEELRLVLELSAREAKEMEEMAKNIENPLESSFLDLQIQGVQISEEELAAQQQMDEDYAAALQLQKDFESENLAFKLTQEDEKNDFAEAKRIQREIRERERRKLDPGSKVSTSFDPEYCEAPPPQLDLEEEEEDFSEEDDEIMAYLDEVRDQQEALGGMDVQAKNGGKGRVTSGVFITKHDITITSIKNAHKIERIMDSGSMKDIRVSNPVYNNLQRDVRKYQSRSNKIRGNKRDVSTAEKVMDVTTKSLVFKMLNSGVLREIHGVVSTGKEANVYHGITGDYEGIEPNQECAVKIFKTTLNEFKNRQEYVEGEFRFRHKKSGHNPRKLIKIWAEKETRNLKRLIANGIKCPTPILLRENILIMSFIGKQGFPSPRLRDAEIKEEKWKEVYHQVIKIMRKMYHDCRLVHADLSEYNLMFRKGEVWVIDVAQSVENDHPHSMDFLKKDCICMSSFFRRKGVPNVMSTRQLFEFVVDPIIKSVDVDNYIERVEQQIQEKGVEAMQEQMKEDSVFLQSFIPRTLIQVKMNASGNFDNETDYHEVVSGLATNDILFQMIQEQNVEEEEEEEGEEEEVEESEEEQK